MKQLFNKTTMVDLSQKYNALLNKLRGTWFLSQYKQQQTANLTTAALLLLSRQTFIEAKWYATCLPGKM